MADRARIGILVVAYNAASTLRSVLDRIPEDFRGRITSVLVSDDHSNDDTYAIGLDHRDRSTDLAITVVRQPRNLGYGGNQKFGYRWAIEHDLDVVVLLHGDGQYAPELLEQMVAPVVDGDADVVLGSRMLTKGGARLGGMPAYKYVGNRILTRVQNALTDLELSEWHSGYRAFSVDALRRIPFPEASDGFDFDTEILIQLHASGGRIAEIPIPTYYGDEICYVDGVRYARDVLADVLRYRLQRMGFGSDSLVSATEGYEHKPDRGSSHQRLLSWVAPRPPGKVLDLGCGDGWVAGVLADRGHRVSGVDLEEPRQRSGLERFVAADLDDGLPREIVDGGPYDLVLAADVIEHVREPEELLRAFHGVLAPGGRVLLSVPNFGHWYPRARVALGRFDYDRRGILDRTHLRFFTARSIRRVLQRTGWHPLRSEATGLPFDVADRGGSSTTTNDPRARRLSERLRATVGHLDAAAVRARPTLFGYQLLFELEPA